MDKTELTDCGEGFVDSLEQVKCDCHMVGLGYRCKGRLANDPKYADVHERLWLWKDDKGERAVTYDEGNHWSLYVPFEVAIDTEKYNQ